MLNLSLLRIIDAGQTPSDVLRQQRASRQLTTKDVRILSRLLKQRIHICEALVEYAIAIAGRPDRN